MSTLQKQLMKAGLPPKGPGSQKQTSFSRVMAGRKRDYTPVPYTKYFESYEDVVIDKNSFRVYQRGNTGPILVLLHGGGFSGLTWSLFSLSLSTMAECQILAMDLRGHGNSHTEDDNDLSAQTLASDVGQVVNAIMEKRYQGTEAPPTILVGHSMGGAVAVQVAFNNYIPGLAGLAVIDVVEGTAMEALTSMHSFLRSRPKHFRSLDQAIEWCVRSGQIHNASSARVSMPGQLINLKTGKLATSDITDDIVESAAPAVAESIACEKHNDCIEEEDESAEKNGSTFKTPSVPDADAGASGKAVTDAEYTWRIDLSNTEKHWSGWFQGLSASFLSVSCPKMLLLAGVDRLDRELTVGQMQGKFQMHVLPQCGHAIHEDVPDKVAEVLATFLVRHKLVEPLCDFQVMPLSC